jgi:aspartyl/asparaginyl-tRNA synthetase
MFARSLALAALAFAAASATAAEYVPGSETTLQGTVSGFHSTRSFWMDVDGDRILVYGTTAQRGRVHTGQTIRVEGSISNDFIKLAAVELQARRIETVRGAGAATASAMSGTP